MRVGLWDEDRYSKLLGTVFVFGGVDTEKWVILQLKQLHLPYWYGMEWFVLFCAE